MRLCVFKEYFNELEKNECQIFNTNNIIFDNIIKIKDLFPT